MREALFFSYLLQDLEITNIQPILHTDSQGCIQVSKDPAKHWKLKHIDTWYHFICDHVQGGDMEIKYTRTANNITDVLTKPLQGLNTSRLTRMIGLEIPLKGGVEDASASQVICTRHSQDTEVQGAHISKEHNEVRGSHLSWAWMLEKQVSWARMLEKQDRGYRQPASSSCTGQRRRSRVEITGNRQAAHAPVKGEGAG